MLLQEASEEHAKALQAAEAKAAKAEEGRKQAIQGCKRSEVRILRHCQTQLLPRSCTCEESKHGSTDFAEHLRQVSNVKYQVHRSASSWQRGSCVAIQCLSTLLGPSKMRACKEM